MEVEAWRGPDLDDTGVTHTLIFTITSARNPGAANGRGVGSEEETKLLLRQKPPTNLGSLHEQ